MQHHAADAPGRVEGRQSARVLGRQAVHDALLRRGHAVIARRAEKQDPLEIHPAHLREAEQRGRHPVVLHRGHDKVALAAGPELHPVVRPFGHRGAMPVAAGAHHLAQHDEGRLLRIGEPGVSCPVGLHLIGIHQRHVLGQRKRPGDQRRVELVAHLVGLPALRRRHDVGLLRADDHDAVGPFRRCLAAVDLVGDVAVDHVPRPGRAADRGVRRIGARDAIEQPVGMGKIEARVQHQRHDLVGGAHGRARDDAEHALAVSAHHVVHAGHLDRLVEMLALDPVLKLAGLVSGVRTDLESRHDDHLDLDRSRPGGQG